MARKKRSPADLARERISIVQTPEETKEFFRKLATDDKFRARLVNHPEAVLAEWHIYVPPGSITFKVQLPAKNELRRLLVTQRAGIPLGPGAPFIHYWFPPFGQILYAPKKAEKKS